MVRGYCSPDDPGSRRNLGIGTVDPKTRFSAVGGNSVQFERSDYGNILGGRGMRLYLGGDNTNDIVGILFRLGRSIQNGNQL